MDFQDAFEKIAAELVAAENCAEWISKSAVALQKIESQSSDQQILREPHLIQARAQLCAEIQGNIGLSIRGLSVYAESGRDPQNIANLDKALKSASSGFNLLDSPEVAELMDVCAARVAEKAKMKADSEVDTNPDADKVLALIADCLITADAVIHEYQVGREPSATHRELVAESIRQLSAASN